jgi:glycosyltransferase involved in cell wall biosynthesis
VSALPLSKIALDASLWDEPTTGIALYTRELAAALEQLGVNVERFGARHSGERPRRLRSRSAFFVGELPWALRQSASPLFHAVSNFNLPWVRVPGKRFVLTVHDLIPDLFPDTVSAAFRWQFRLWLMRSLQTADRIICVSERTREDLLRRFRVSESKVDVVLHGVDHVDRVRSPDAVSAQYLQAQGLPSRYVLYAGSLDVRKNVALVLDACEQLHTKGRKVTLVLVGQAWFGSGSVEKRVAQLRASGMDIRPLGYQPDAVFYALIRGASVFVFPSRYEGFGLPPLEAMRLGVPTIVSNAGSLPEVVGESALRVAPDDAQSLAEHLSRLLSTESERADWSRKGKERTQDMTWRKTAEATLEVYRKALI